MILFLIFVLLNYINGFGQAKPDPKEEDKIGFFKEAIGSLNLTQSSFDNWTQGGENSFSWQLNFNMGLSWKYPQYDFSNTLKITYGKVRVGTAPSRKSVDEVKLESVFKYKIGLYVNPYASFIGGTQMTRGYNYDDGGKSPVSDFFDPAYFTQSLGFGYAYRELFKSRMGVALKQTITRNFPVPYTDDPATSKIEKLRFEYGAQGVTDLKVKFATNILLTSKLEMFSNLKALKEVDVRWDSILSAKVAKYFSVNFNFKLFYDRDISKKRQILQSLSMGLTYTFL